MAIDKDMSEFGEVVSKGLYPKNKASLNARIRSIEDTLKSFGQRGQAIALSFSATYREVAARSKQKYGSPEGVANALANKFVQILELKNPARIMAEAKNLLTRINRDLSGETFERTLLQSSAHLTKSRKPSTKRERKPRKKRFAKPSVSSHIRPH